jgi:two-component system, chemotaxis family, sensor kinase CheA
MNKNDKNLNEFEDEIEIVTEELETEHDLKVLNDCWHISIHPRGEISEEKNNPKVQIKKLNSIGKIKRFEVINNGNKLESALSYSGFEIDFRCDKTKNEIESFFNSLRDDYKIRILPPNSNISDYIELIEDLSDKNRQIGEILKEIGSLTDFELNEVLNIQKELFNEESKSEGQKPIGELLVNEKILQESVIKAALQKQEKIKSTSRN